MKKYLMSGIAALALCAAFTSCSNKEDLYDQGQINQNAIEKAQKDYAAAFIATFGQPAANQDWGFGSRSFTRGTYDADHPGSYPNANMWADDGWKAPTEMSPGQIARVKAYFQANPHLTYVDPEYQDFFIQQVYKGNPQTRGPISPEEYTYANDKTETGSEHMDHLTVGLTNNGNALDHIFNFNKGRYSSENANDPNGTRRDNVQNYPGVTYLYNNSDGKTHQDHIMLITQSNTKAVGFFESNGSVEHNDCCANASAQTIDEWASKPENYVNGQPIGETVYDSQWERSFVGLDYEAKSPEAAYYKNGNNQKVEATLGVITNRGQYAWDGEHYLLWDNIQNQTLKQFFNLDYEVYFISDQTNGILAETSNYNGQGDLLIKRKGSQIGFDGLGAEQDYDVFDLTKISDKLDMGYIPVWGKGYVEWVTNIGGRDYVFSDWIITLTKASQVEVERYDIRVIAEDLNANAADDARTDEDSDWDFNDVVFDIKFLDPAIQVDGQTVNVKIRVVAAGGTYPLYIEDQEVHGLFGQNTDVMINTEASRYGKHFDTTTLPEIYLYSATAKQTNGKDIHIYVDKGNGNIELTAEVGLPAAKLGVSPNFNFCKERVDITGQYPLFIQWVRTATPQAWWNSNITGN